MVYGAPARKGMLQWSNDVYGQSWMIMVDSRCRQLPSGRCAAAPSKSEEGEARVHGKSVRLLIAETWVQPGCMVGLCSGN